MSEKKSLIKSTAHSNIIRPAAQVTIIMMFLIPTILFTGWTFGSGQWSQLPMFVATIFVCFATGLLLHLSGYSKISGPVSKATFSLAWLLICLGASFLYPGILGSRPLLVASVVVTSIVIGYWIMFLKHRTGKPD